MTSPTAPVMVVLDRPRPLRWTTRAEIRLASLDRPPAFADLAKPRRMAYAVAAHLWAALDESGQPFAVPEDLSVHLDTPEKFNAAFDALVRALRAAGVIADEKKTSAPATIVSTNGPSASSSSASAAPAMTPST